MRKNFMRTAFADFRGALLAHEVLYPKGGITLQ